MSFGILRKVTGAVLGTFVIFLGLEIVRWLETGPIVLAVDLPKAMALYGSTLGAVIVFNMALHPSSVLGQNEIEVLFLKINGER